MNRTRALAARAVAAGALAAATVTACSAGPAAVTSTSTSTSTGGASRSPTPSPSAHPTAPAAVAAKVSKPLVDKNSLAVLGKAGVNSAWKFSADIGSTYAYDPALMAKPTQNLGAADFKDLRAAMTAGARKDWDKSVRGLPGVRSHQEVNDLATVGVNINGTRLRPTQPVTRFVIAGGVLAFEDGDVVTTQTQTAVLHLIDRNGDPVKTTAVRTVTLNLVKKNGHWKIESWESESEPWVVESDG